MKTIAEHILDIVQNSITAKATLVEIMVIEDKIGDILHIEIKDNGCGMDKLMLEQAANPFFTSRTTRKVGLGLSLLKQNAEKAGGEFSIESEKNRGTIIQAIFQYSNIDRPPFGNFTDSYLMLAAGNKNVEFNYAHKTNFGFYELSSKELYEALGDISPFQKEVNKAIIEMITHNLKKIKAYN